MGLFPLEPFAAMHFFNDHQAADLSRRAFAECYPAEIHSMVQQYPAVASAGHGCFRGPPVHIHVDPTTPPRYQPCRPVPFALSTKIEDAIDKNVAQGLWVPVQDYRWASAIVPVPKKDGSMRLCADYKGTVNPIIAPDSYRTPTVEEVLNKLSGGVIFGEIDLADAYTQITVDEETSRLLAVNTVKGLFRVTRLPFGVKVASGIFQRVMDSLLAGIKGAVAYQDNVYLRAESLAAYKDLLPLVLQALSDAGLKVNANKCTWAATELNVLGFKISKNGISPLEEKLAAIKNRFLLPLLPPRRRTASKRQADAERTVSKRQADAERTASERRAKS